MEEWASKRDAEDDRDNKLLEESFESLTRIANVVGQRPRQRTPIQFRAGEYSCRSQLNVFLKLVQLTYSE